MHSREIQLKYADIRGMDGNKTVSMVLKKNAHNRNKELLKNRHPDTQNTLNKKCTLSTDQKKTLPR